MRAVLAAAVLMAGAAQADGVPRVPSGQPVTLLEEVWPDPGAPGEKIARFRFVAPKLSRGGKTEDDMMALCEAVARPFPRCSTTGTRHEPAQPGAAPAISCPSGGTRAEAV